MTIFYFLLNVEAYEFLNLSQLFEIFKPFER
jgi:hypothetical protein